MNLQEEIKRMRQMMGLLTEEKTKVTGNCESCKLKNLDKNKLKEFWDDQSKTTEQKIELIKKEIDPILISVKNYYLEYIKGEFFKNKIKELSQKKGQDWLNQNQKSAKKFIESIEFDYTIYCQESLGGYVDPITYYTVQICANNLYPGIETSNLNLLITHEMKHSLDIYLLKSEGIVNTASGEDWSTSAHSAAEPYETREWEDSARIQNLRNALGSDDFGTFENFKSLLQKSLNIRYKNNNGDVLDSKWEIVGNNLEVELPNINDWYHSINNTVTMINNKNYFDVNMLLFNNRFMKVTNPTVEQNKEYKMKQDVQNNKGSNYYIAASENGNPPAKMIVDLLKIYNFTQKFAKNDNSNNQYNYG